MRSSELRPNRVFKSVDFKAGPQVLTIVSIKKENVSLRNKPASFKLVVRFKETVRQSWLTSKRKRVISLLFGSKSKNAIGKRIELYRCIGLLKSKKVPFVAFRAPCKVAKK